MMASIPNMRSTPLPLPTAKAPAGEAAPGDFAAQLPVVPGQPIEAVTLPAEAIAEPTMPSLPLPEDLKSGAPAGDGDSAAEVPDSKTGPRREETPETADVVIPFLQNQPVPPSQPLTVSANAPTETAAAPAPVATGKSKAKACDQDGKAGQPVPDGSETPVEPAATREVEAAVKQLLQRKLVLAKQVAAAPKAAPVTTAGTEAAQAAAQPQLRTPARSETPVAIQANAPQPTAELPQPASVSPMAQPEPATTEKTGIAEGTRTTELDTERKLDLVRDSQWLDRLARDIAQAGANDSPLRFRLHPQTLGHLHVELQQGDHGTAVRLTVETEAARQILTDAQPRLAAEARAQGVRIAETHVDLSGSGRHAPGDQRRQDEARQTPLIRTARGAGANGPARASARARLDRYA